MKWQLSPDDVREASEIAPGPPSGSKQGAAWPRPQRAPAHTPMMRGPVAPKDAGRALQPPIPPQVCVRSTGGLPVGLDEERMREEFARYDVDGNGYLNRNELKALYKEYESFGVRQSDGEVEELVKGMGMLDDGRVSFDEFCLLLLKIEAR